MKEGQYMFWINIDKPTKTVTIHSDTCKYVVKKETKYKGIERERRDGGWYTIDSTIDAQQFYYYSYPHFQRKICANCHNELNIKCGK